MVAPWQESEMGLGIQHGWFAKNYLGLYVQSCFFNMFHADVSFLWVGWFTCITSGSSPLAWHPYINVSYSLQSALIRRIPVGSRGFFLLVLGLIASAKSSITGITVDLWWTRC
jgi:hypothetical protein